jgi:AcrR family transcriptional regulator/DNA-binding MarR family transcriptional regulator
MGARDVTRARAGNHVTRRPGTRFPASDTGVDGGSPQLQVAEIQRTRLLNATVSAMDELGYADVTVAHITARARVSRRTFYELFENREQCILAVFDDALERMRQELVRVAEGVPWRERVRTGLWTILSFFDREPGLARVCLVQSARGDESVLARRTELFAQLARVIDEGRKEGPRAQGAPALTAEGLVGAAHAIVSERVLRRDNEMLAELLPSLMSLIVFPYLGAAAARREQTRAVPATAPARESFVAAAQPGGADWLQGLPMRLTYRTVRVLHAVRERPGISNRQVGADAGVADQGQISKLLARLERLGLIANGGQGHVKGEANAWRLTPAGERLAQSIQPPAPNHVRAA